METAMNYLPLKGEEKGWVRLTLYCRVTHCSSPGGSLRDRPQEACVGGKQALRIEAGSKSRNYELNNPTMNWLETF